MQFIKTDNDITTTLEKALSEIDEGWKKYNGVLVAGTHNFDKIEERIELIKEARENNIPFLGICGGLQLAVIEFARNVLGIQNATSEEFSDDRVGLKVVEKMPQMRVGVYPVYWSDGVISFENFWHNYKISEEILPALKSHFQVSVYKGITEAIRLNNHSFFCAFQFHAEYSSSKNDPHPILVDFIKVCKKSTYAKGN